MYIQYGIASLRGRIKYNKKFPMTDAYYST